MQITFELETMKPIVQQITDSPEYMAFIAALEELRKIRNASA